MKTEMRSRRLRARIHVARALDGTLQVPDKTIPKPFKRDPIDEVESDDDLSDDEGIDSDDDDASSTSTAQPTTPAAIIVGQNPDSALPIVSGIATNTIAPTTTPGPNPISPLAPPTTTLFTSTTRTVNAGVAASGGSVINGAARSGSEQDAVSVSTGAGLPAGAKAGIALGAIAGLALLSGLLFILWRRRLSSKPTTTTTPPPANPRTDSQILNDLMSAAHAHQNGNGNGSSFPQHYIPTDADEKHPSGSRVTLLEAAPVGPQPVIRSSIASWLRRHHPLKLNPGPLASARGSMFTVTSNRSSTASSQAPVLPAVPPAYTNNGGVPVLPVVVAAPAPLRRAQMPVLRFQSVWSESSVAPSSVSEGDTLADLYGSRAEEDRRSGVTEGLGR
ncbi:hypothetical protein B0T25DRAFT_559750 [Lasiosphaeria hispida]|uniref:Uncharacterized protein n=1 Tax=Lasiosphaeria hispida TaxID=260671 RepID=A0AAJ0H837_9PEZI|nr:hypothetical protein B0T25DRAFT_559750 [Lasiosphaeria hispida]